MRTLRLAIFTLMSFGLLLPRPVLSADVSVSATIQPEVVTVGDQATLVVTVQGKFRKSAKPELPKLDDFFVYDSGTSQNLSFVNGAVSSSLSFSYVLVPKKEGTFTIAPIKFRLGDKEYEANPVTLEAVKQAASSAPPPKGEEQVPSRKSTSQGNGFFITASVDKDTVFVNQQITWTLHFYLDSRANLLESPSFTPPEAEGFWVEDLPPMQKYYKTVQGRQYLVNELKRGYFPTAPGEYVIGPAEVTVTGQDVGFPSWDDLFNRSFRSFGFGKPTTLRTEEKRIIVLPLPEHGKPPDFSGVVGHDIHISRSIDKQVVQEGEPVNVTVELEGEGNMKTASLPELKQLDDFKVYQSGSSSNVFRKDYVVSGQKKYEYVLVPKREGIRTFPPLELSYFDPVERRYEVASAPTIRLDVKPGTKEESREIIYAGAGNDIKILGSDIKYIHPVPAVLSLDRHSFYKSRVYLSLHLFPALAVVFALVVERRKKKWRENTSLSRSHGAARAAAKKLGAAKRLLKQDRGQEVFTAVASALNGYWADKMNVSAAGLKFQDIEDFLKGKAVDLDVIDKARIILSNCDAARYANQSGAPGEAASTLQEAEQLIKTVEKRYL